MSIFDHWKHELEHLGHHIEDVGRHVEHDVQQAATTGEHVVQQAASKAVADVEHAGKAALDTIERHVHNTLSSAAAAAIKKGLADALKLLDEWGPESVAEIGLELGPLQFVVGDIPKHYALIKESVRHPPDTLERVIGLVEALSPDTVTVSWGFTFTLVFVEIDALSVGGHVTVATSRFLEKARAHAHKTQQQRAAAMPYA